jgi:hypothetical protein
MATALNFKLVADLPEADRQEVLRAAKSKFKNPLLTEKDVGFYEGDDGSINQLTDIRQEGGIGGMARTIGREIGWNVLPAAAAVLGGGVGTALGAAYTGPGAAVAAPAGGIVGGLTAGIGGTLAQDAVARKLAESSETVADLVRTREMGRRVNPWSARLGNLVTGFGFAKPVLTKDAMAKLLAAQTGKEVSEITGKQVAGEVAKQAAIGAGVGGAAEAVNRGAIDEEVLNAAIMGAAGGATQIAPQLAGKPLGRLAERIAGGVLGKPPEALPRQVSKELPKEVQPEIPAQTEISTDTLRNIAALPPDADMLAVSKALQRDRPDMLPLSGDATDVDLWRRKATELLGQRMRTDPIERARLAGEAYEHVAQGGDVKQLPQPFQREIAGMAAKYGGALTKADWQALATRQRPEDYLTEILPRLTEQKAFVNAKLAVADDARREQLAAEEASKLAGELGKLQQEQEVIPPDATKAPFDTGAIPAAEGNLVPPKLVRTEEGVLQSYGSVPEGTQAESGLPMVNPLAAGAEIPTAPAKPKVVRAGGAKSGTPTPEGQQVIDKQLELTADPATTKAATLVTPGDVIPKVPKGMKAIPTEQGLLVVNPKKADPVAVAEAMTTAQGATKSAAQKAFEDAAFDYVASPTPQKERNVKALKAAWDAEQSGLAPAKPLGLGAEVAESPVAVATDVGGVPNVLSELVTPETLSTAVAAQQAATGGKGNTKVLPAQEVVAGRQQADALAAAKAELESLEAELSAKKEAFWKATRREGEQLESAVIAFGRRQATGSKASIAEAQEMLDAAQARYNEAAKRAGIDEIRSLNAKAEEAFQRLQNLETPVEVSTITRKPEHSAVPPVLPQATPPTATPPVLGKPVKKSPKVKVKKSAAAMAEPAPQKTLQQLDAEYQQQHDALAKKLEQAEQRLMLVEDNQPEFAVEERAKVAALEKEMRALEAQGQRMVEDYLASTKVPKTEEPSNIPPTRDPAHSGAPLKLVKDAVHAGFDLIDRMLVKPVLGRWKAAMDKIVDLEPNGRGRELQAADLERERWVTQVQNQDRASYGNAFSGLRLGEYNRVRQYMEDNYYDGVSLVRPTEREQTAINLIRGTLLAQAHRMRQIGANLVEGFRFIIENPNYIPAAVKASIRDALANVSPNHADPVKRTEYQKLLDEWTRHYMARSGGNFQEAQAAFDKWRGQFSGRSLLNGSEYAAVRNAERYGIPRAWQEDLRVALDRHAVRSALDLGWWKYIQNNPKLAKWLGIPDNGAGVTYTPEPGEPLGYNPTVERWLQAQTAYRTQNPHPLLALSGLAGSTMLGPMSAAKDLMATPFISASLVSPDVAIAATAKTALKAFGDSARRAGSASSHNAAMAEKLTDQTVDTMLTRIRDFASRIQGRQLADTIGREWAFQFGGNVNDIMMSRPGYRDWLKRLELGQGWETADPNTLRTLVGDHFVDAVQSKYNAHTLPEQLLPTKDNDLNLLFWSLARWSVSRMNSFEKHVWRPAVNGDYGPLLSALGAGALGVAAEEKLRELFNSRAPNYWQPSELSSAADKEHLYTALAYINSNNITGALGAIPFMLAQIAHGEKPSSGPVNLAVNASESLQQRLAQFWNAVHTEGANVPKALADTAKAIAEDNLQFVRILTRMNKDKDWNREEALWKRQTGRGGLGSSFGRKDVISPVAQFQNATTQEEASQLYPALEAAMQQPKVGKPVVQSAMRGEIGPRPLGEQPGFYEWARQNGLPADEIMQQDMAKEAFNASVLRPMINQAWEANRLMRERAIRSGQMQVAPQ